MSQFLRDQASDSDEVVTPLMLDGTYLSRNFPPSSNHPSGVRNHPFGSEENVGVQLLMDSSLDFILLS